MQWNLVETTQIPEWFIQEVKKYLSSSGIFAAQLLWQRGIKTELELARFVNHKNYQPASPFEFGQEMNLAVERLKKAATSGEKVAIWGDFDADGITSTAVLWDGLGEFFIQQEKLTYYIPNRLTESHGLNVAGIDNLAQQECTLIVTCDTGSTNIDEIIYAQKLGIDVIVTDHHTLPTERPPVSAIINPRYLPETHPLFHLSGVAVAYKLVEGLYQTLPDVPQKPVADLLDLVAIGLIADLVQLSGDCRYLAKLGLQRLYNDSKSPTKRRPGVGILLELCQKSGDRPTDISFGLGPRINAVSRIQGDASFCVELLTSRDMQRCQKLAQETELANTRRKSLQKDVQNQVLQKLSQLDLSTTSVIVLEDPQWAVGVLGLVAGQIAQETGKPTILLSTEIGDLEANKPKLARGSARSINGVDLYQLVKEQEHLLHRFGGHPFAAGLSLLAENIPLFTDAINQKLRQHLAGVELTPTVQADLIVTVADLGKNSGKDLFLELKLLEPCGMGNHVPKLLIKNCCFENTWHRNQEDLKGQKIQYIKTEFNIRDDSSKIPFPGIWWGHYKEELPEGRCDCIAEIDFNSYEDKKRNRKPHYEIRLIDVRPCTELEVKAEKSAMILDWRNQDDLEFIDDDNILIVKDCPTSWEEVRLWVRKSIYHQKKLALAWQKPEHQIPQDIWLKLVGIAKFLSRTNQLVTRVQFLERLGISDLSLYLGFHSLRYLGFNVKSQDSDLQITWDEMNSDETKAEYAISKFLSAIQEEQFQQEYFTTVPISIIEAIALNGLLTLFH
ncbi:single-stranded-DNA-specific exonuclease RecJ [Okeanomitos corallinicola TIOX110]|uniref:Single-stranded-DNA-specific exonuclease RecJ n=1 Tax=Okeanomitos corallinicola TIOX110 TaxID=3133117 RepID=A0ABZ2UVQ8_9CYAN